MDIVIKKIFKKIRKILKKGELNDLNNLLSQEKYTNLFQNMIKLNGDQVKQIIDELLQIIIEGTKEQLQNILDEGLKDEVLLDRFHKILNDQLIQVYWISIIFNQFNDFVFLSFHQMSIQQYCLKSILDNSFGKHSKNLVAAIVEALSQRKSLEISQRFSTDLVKIINYFSFRTFLNNLSIKKSLDYQMDVIFNCDFTEEKAAKLIMQQELEKREQEMYLIKSDNDDENENEGEQNKIIEEEKIIVIEQINENVQKDKIMEEEVESDKKKEKKKKKKIRNRNSFESFYSQIERKYMKRLISDSEAFLANIKKNKVSEQIKDIEEYMYREEQFISYYLNRLSIKVADKLFSMCVISNYTNLVNHPQYGLSHLFLNKDISALSDLYKFVQNDQQSYQLLGTALTDLIEQRIQDIEREQENLFANYEASLQAEKQNSMMNEDDEIDEDNQKVKDIQFISSCQDKWIEQIYQLYQDMHTDGLCLAFENNSTLEIALNRGFEHQLHVSEVGVEYLVNTCHLLLLQQKYRLSPSTSHLHHNQDKLIAIISKLFSFISQKDFFLEIYSDKLSRRLLYSLSTSQEAEELFLDSLEGVVGSINQIKSMKTMMADLKKNVLLQSDYLAILQPEQQSQTNNESLDQKNKENTIEKLNSKASNKSRRSRSRSRSRSKSNQRQTRQSRLKKMLSSSEDSEDSEIDQEMVYLHSDNDDEEEEEKNGEEEEMEIIEISDFPSRNGDENKVILLSESENQVEKKKSQNKQNGKDKEVIDLEMDDKEVLVIEDEEYEKLSHDAVHISILTEKKWPLKQKKASKDVQIPSFLQRKYDDYANQYLKEFKQRKLQLLHHCSYASLIFRSDSKSKFNGVYTLKVSSYAMILLLRFNHNQELKLSQLHSQTQMKKKILLQKLNLLVKYNILLVNAEKGHKASSSSISKGNLDASYKVNKHFSFKKAEIEIDWIPADEVYSQKMISALRSNQGLSKVTQQTSSEITHYRKNILNCHIVKSMKEKEKLAQDDLIKQVLNKLKNNKDLFTPSNNAIKEQIKDCISKSLIKFSDLEEEKDFLLYIK